MSAPDEKQVTYSGDPAQIDPVRKPTDQQPGETRDQHFLRMFRGAFFGPNAMRNHMGRKAKKVRK